MMSSYRVDLTILSNLLQSVASYIDIFTDSTYYYPVMVFQLISN